MTAPVALGRAAALKEKAALLRSMLAETEKQGEMLAREDLDGLERSIDARQGMMDAVDALDVKLSGMAGAAAAGDEEALRQEIGQLLRQIMEKDEANRQKAGELAGTFMTGIRQTNAERNLWAYQPQGGSESKFINRQG